MKKKAKIVRMVAPHHLCPWGVKAKDLLKRSGYELEDEQLPSMEENERYKKENGYQETPQIWIEGEYIGGYDELREHLGKGPDPKEGETYQPVIVVYAMSLLMALATCWAILGQLELVRTLELFVPFLMCVLGILKLQDLHGFATGFVQYDLLARRWVPYANIYAFVEAGAGILMIAMLGIWIAAPAALLISAVGAVSIIKAAYIEKRDLNCACVGGGSSVPLGFLSLTENLLMMAMAVWMLVKVM